MMAAIKHENSRKEMINQFSMCPYMAKEKNKKKKQFQERQMQADVYQTPCEWIHTNHRSLCYS